MVHKVLTDIEPDTDRFHSSTFIPERFDQRNIMSPPRPNVGKLKSVRLTMPAKESCHGPPA